MFPYYLNVSFRYFGFVPVFQFCFGKSRYRKISSPWSWLVVAKPQLAVVITRYWFSLYLLFVELTHKYGKCSKISNTLKLRTPKIIPENNFQNILKNGTLTFFGKVNF